MFFAKMSFMFSYLSTCHRDWGQSSKQQMPLNPLNPSFLMKKLAPLSCNTLTHSKGIVLHRMSIKCLCLSLMY